jgi:diadenosine tetraphosphate (Ap4A) HIT family hydrolase
MEHFFNFAKLNVAALGNVVSQLHLHHVGRFIDDPAWPGPVWGHSTAIPYSVAEIEKLRQVVRAEFTGLLPPEQF